MRCDFRPGLPWWNYERLRQHCSYQNQKSVLDDSLFSVQKHERTKFQADKGPYMNLERRRWAKLFDVPMTDVMPPGFPANTLPVSSLRYIVFWELLLSCLTSIQIQRALTAISVSAPGRLAETLDVLYRASFAEHKAVHEPQTLFDLLASIHGEEGTRNILEQVGVTSPMEQMLQLKFIVQE